MATTFLEELSPPGLRAAKIVLALADARDIPRAFAPVLITVSYAALVSDGGAMLPLELLVKGPSQASLTRHVYRRVLPSQITIQPREGGSYLVLLREIGHNQHYGQLVVEVEGAQIE